ALHVTETTDCTDEDRPPSVQSVVYVYRPGKLLCFGVKPGKIGVIALRLRPMCEKSASAKTSRKSVVTWRSSPLKRFGGVRPGQVSFLRISRPPATPPPIANITPPWPW